MKRKIFRNMFIISIITVILTSLLISIVLYRKSYNDMLASVKKETEYIAAAIELNKESYLNITEKIKNDNRITLVASDGSVVYDNIEKAEQMENHLNRTEIKSALENGSGEASRLSQTTGKVSYYYAVLLDNGMVLRISSTTNSLLSDLIGYIPYIFLIMLIVFILALLISKKQTNQIVVPINSLDLERPLSNDVYDEFTPLLRRLEKQNSQIREQMLQLEKQKNEFNSITENMKEGLVLLNSSNIVLSVNKSAQKIFNIKSPVLGEHYLLLNRSQELKAVIDKAISGTSAEEKLKINGRCYQLITTPIFSDTAVGGAVLLILDITEKDEAEQLRREFSANVSHELKTPLTSIYGYAEIIKSGIAKSEDIPRFAEQIYNETSTLITLVDDIIKLSRLDERNMSLPSEDVDLYSLCELIISRLSEKAKKEDVTVTLKGSLAVIKGSGQLLSELIYNLTDNAIKYNKKGGKVDITVTEESNSFKLTIADTGIGIPTEHQSRIFERFYRVDKSRSKATGGTGLGLSIAKYAAKYHNAKIELESTQGKGSTFTVIFNK